MRKYITPNRAPYIKALSAKLDLEYCRDFNILAKTDKTVILHGMGGAIPGDKPSLELRVYRQRRKTRQPVLVCERGALPNTMFLDPNGFLVGSSSYHSFRWDKPLTIAERERVRRYVDHFIHSDSSLEKQPRRIAKSTFEEMLKLKDSRRRIFVPLQLENDYVIRRWPGWTGGVHAFFEYLKVHAAQHDDLVFIVKNHPLAETKEVADTDNFKLADRLHYKDCIEYCDAVLTINSGVGLQAMMWRKPVYIAGEAFYSFYGLNKQIFKEKYFYIDIRKEFEVNYELMLRFIHYLKFKFYSDCVLIKAGRDINRNRTTECQYLDIRIIDESDVKENDSQS